MAEHGEDKRLHARYQSAPSSSCSSSEESIQRSVRKNGRYINPWPSAKFPTLRMFIKFVWFTRSNSRVPSQQVLNQTLPIVQPDLDMLKEVPKRAVRVTWIGHATLLVQMEGLTILTDPIFSTRCSPVQFLGPKRYRDVPCCIHDLPKVDAVLISHTHYDHLDYNSVQTLNARFGADTRWFVPMGLRQWMTSVGCENVIELDWWDENCIPEYPGVKFVFTPAQHWSKRTLIDDNKALWGSWCVVGPKKRFYFAGDTGYCTSFEQIGQRYGPFDLAAIPIGAYEPRWIMQNQHIDPGEAVQIHQDIRAKHSIGIHWGTFDLSYEYYLEPPERLREALEDKNIPPEHFFTLKHGETRVLGEEKAENED